MKTDDKPLFTERQLKVLTEELKEKGLHEKDIERFQIICERTRLDPFTKQIFARAQNASVENPDGSTGWKKELVIITSIDGLRAVAESTGEYRGQDGPYWCNNDGQWNDVWLPTQKFPLAAKVGVLRKDFPAPLFGVARFDSYVQLVGKGEQRKPNHFWLKMSDVLTAKCAEANALRRAFPQLLSGVFIEEEIVNEDDPARDEAIEKAQKEVGKPVEPVEPKAPQVEEEVQKKAPKGSKKAPAAAAAPETPAEPEKPAQDQQTQAAAPSEPAWKSHKLTQLKVERYKDKLVGELTEKDLTFIHDKWIKPNAEAFAEIPEKEADANAVLQALGLPILP